MSIYDPDSAGPAYQRSLRALPERLIDALDLVRELRDTAKLLSYRLGHDDERAALDKRERDRIQAHADDLERKIETRTGWFGLRVF